MRLPFALAIALFAAATPALAEDRPPTPDETQRLTRVLNASGFERWDSVKLDDDGYWDVDDARRAGDATKWDVRLDAETFAVIRIQRDD